MFSGRGRHTRWPREWSADVCSSDLYLKIIGLLSTLDAPQTRTALLISLDATDPSVQSIMAVIAQQEAVHNESYSYVLSSVVSLEVLNLSFEVGRKDPVFLDRNTHVT